MLYNGQEQESLIMTHNLNSLYRALNIKLKNCYRYTM